MRIAYHEKYGLDHLRMELLGRFDFVEPSAASEEDLRMIHDDTLISRVKRVWPTIYEAAKLAVGGAIKAAEMTVQGELSFGLIRPAGHHASRSYTWGYCYFNNIAIAVEKLRREGKIEKALIVDTDVHYGDGTAKIFGGSPNVSYYHLSRGCGAKVLSKILATKNGYDLLAVSAGFDSHKLDWKGGWLTTEDYREIGLVFRDYADRECGGRCFAVLEGGYNPEVLGRNVRALLEGMSS